MIVSDGMFMFKGVSLSSHQRCIRGERSLSNIMRNCTDATTRMTLLCTFYSRTWTLKSACMKPHGICSQPPNSLHAKIEFPFILHLILDTTLKTWSETIVLFPMHLTCLGTNGIYMRDGTFYSRVLP
ncbi:hypothetical protein P692DRAFT_201196379 [Suillus brevipes Sb2]|nr:hypothetical protein P692DRAFT_201196379 [Suillus brevipes Sb2]